MALSKGYKKNIACLESSWNDDIENRLTVGPVLELLSRKNGIKFALLTSNTKDEFEYNLALLSSVFYKFGDVFFMLQEP